MNAKEEQLIAAYLAGENVADALLQECRDNPELLKDLAELVAVERMLLFNAEDESDEIFVAEVKERLRTGSDDSFTNAVRNRIDKEQPRKTIPFMKIAIAASLALICGLFALTRTQSPVEFAQVMNTTAAVWGNDQSTTPSLSKGPVVLNQGYAKLLMNNGVILTLEAPISFDIKSVNLIKVHHGRLVARVPEQAIGFTVMTPSSEVIDLGTEFGIDVDEKGGSEVHVIEGEVKARGLKEKSFVNLYKDDARAFDENHKMAIIESQPDKFLRALPGHSADSPEYLQWSCDEEEEVTCRGTGIKGQFYNGALKALNDGQKPQYQNGQFGEALYFNGESAYVETSFPGIGNNNPRTVAFWAKVPNNFSTRNGYGMISWGLMKKGAAWQISPNPAKKEGPLGRGRIGTMNAPVVGTTDLRDNRWHHIAIVMYGGRDAATSTHILMYVDGKLEKTHLKSIAKIKTKLDHRESRPLMFGRNMAFQNESKDNKNKFFKGWLDEIYIFDAALDQDQIKNIMKHNRLTPLTSSRD